MPASMLETQLQTLEEPAPEERPLVVSVDGTLEHTVSEALAALRQAEAGPVTA
jgi:gluconate kinase